MSDNYIYVIPKDPHLVFDENTRQKAAALFRSIAPEAEEITTSVSEHVTFVDCAANFERILCPSCGEEIELRAWHRWMDKDFDGKGFVFSHHTTPCCDTGHFSAPASLRVAARFCSFADLCYEPEHWQAK